MKIATIRKSLIKQSIVLGGIVSLVGGALFYIVSLDEEYDLEINSLKTSAQSISKQVIDLTVEYDKANNNLLLYQDIKQKLTDKKLNIDKLVLRDVISAARNKYIVDKLDVKIDQIKILDTPEYKKEKAVAQSTVINISLDSLTDIDTLGIMQSIEKAFWGAKFTSLKLSFEKEVDNAALIAIKDTGFSPLVNAKFTVILYGLKQVIPSTAESLTELDSVKPTVSGR